MTTPTEILNAAMSLSAEDRAAVAHKLLLSLEPSDFDSDVEREWAVEIRRRLQAIRQGNVPLRDWDDALEDIRKSIMAKNQE